MASPPPPPPFSSTAAAGGPHSVFVYGTLMAEEVVRAVLPRAPPQPRFSIRGRVYPAILPVRSKKVSGKVFKGITDRELNVLDIFEDEEYVRTTVETSLTEWKKVHLKDDYLTMTQDFVEELEQLESKTQA